MKAMRFMLPVCGILAVAAAVVGFVFRGGVGALGAAAGVVLISALFVLSTYVITWVDAVNRPMLLAAAIAVYGFKLLALFVVLNALSGWAGIKPMALGVVAGGLGWVCGYTWWVWHARLTLEFPEQRDDSRLRRD